MQKKARIGFALCGSFCTFAAVIPQLAALARDGYEIFPIMSQTAYTTDTRFGKAADFNSEIEALCSKSIMHRLTDVEPIGPKSCSTCSSSRPARQHAGQTCLGYLRYSRHAGGKSASAQRAACTDSAVVERRACGQCKEYRHTS